MSADAPRRLKVVGHHRVPTRALLGGQSLAEMTGQRAIEDAGDTWVQMSQGQARQVADKGRDRRTVVRPATGPAQDDDVPAPQ
jgi:hypothetical protein